MQLPGVDVVNNKRIAKFKQRIGDTLAAGELGVFQQLIEQYQGEHNVPAIEIAAALAKLVQGNAPLLLKASERTERPFESMRSDRERPPARGARPDRDTAPASSFRQKPESSISPHHKKPDSGLRKNDEKREPEAGLETFRIEVGHAHGVKPNNIVGAIANEAGLDSKHIGRIDIRDDYTLVDLPEGMPSDVFKLLKKVWVSGQQLRITRAGESPDEDRPTRSHKPFKPKPAKVGGFERPKRPPPPKHRKR